MLAVLCSGTPKELGQAHGSTATLDISRSITFYKALFQSEFKMSWHEVQAFALKYDPYLQAHWPQYIAEMQGVADGAGVTYEDILALNVRTEVEFGNFNDGSTAFSWKGKNSSISAQNWDWNIEQAENLICLQIKKPNGLGIQMVTEAGIIGKIGMNSNGVGCTLNALKPRGVSSSRQAAIATLEKSGVASACYILIGDATGGTGLECSSDDLVRLEMNKAGIVTHTNHYVLKHKGSVIEAKDWLPDTRLRLRRIDDLLNGAKEEDRSQELAAKLLKDETEGDGEAICRSSKPGKDDPATPFSTITDLQKRKASVAIGRPASSTEILILDP